MISLVTRRITASRHARLRAVPPSAPRRRARPDAARVTARSRAPPRAWSAATASCFATGCARARDERSDPTRALLSRVSPPFAPLTARSPPRLLVRPRPPRRRLALLPHRSTFRSSQEVTVSSDGGVSVTLPPTDPRAAHARDVLRVKPGDSLRVGVVDGAPATARVETCPSDSAPDDPLALVWRPGEELGDEDTTRRRLRPAAGGADRGGAEDELPSFSPPPPPPPHLPARVDLLLAMPRPKVMARLWAPLASMGVGRIVLTNAARVERYYFDAGALDRAKVEAEIVRGLEQSGDTRSPVAVVARRFPAAFDALGGITGSEPRAESVEWLAGGAWGGRGFRAAEDAADAEDSSSVVMLLAQPGARTSMREALRGCGRDGWGYGPRRVVVAVGPEGGWSAHERETMVAMGFREVALGNRTFATDVAAISLIAAVRERTDSW